MTEPVEDERRAYDTAAKRAAANPNGIGAAYAGRAARNPGEAPSPGWRGVVAIAEAETSNVQILVMSESRSRYAAIEPAALAEAIEEIGAENGGVEGLRRLSQEGPGLRLDEHAGDRLSAIFP